MQHKVEARYFTRTADRRQILPPLPHTLLPAREVLKLRLDADAKGSRVAPEGIGAAGACGAGGAADAGDVVLVGHIAHERLNLPALVIVAQIEVEQTARAE